MTLLFLQKIILPMKNIILIFLLIGTNEVRSQISENYFNNIDSYFDSQVTCGIEVHNSIIIGGQIKNSNFEIPYLAKIDTSGSVIWSTIHNKDSMNYGKKITNIIHADSSLYAISSSGNSSIWRVNEPNGSIDWKISNLGGTTEHILDYDDQHIIAVNTGSYNGSTYLVEISLIEKDSGIVSSTYQIGRVSWKKPRVALAVDSSKNVYVTLSDSIFKLSNNNLDSIIWKRGSNFHDFQKAYIDNNDSLFLFGSKSGFSRGKGKILAINKTTGSTRWTVESSSDDAFYSDFVDKGGYLFVTWRASFIGGGTKYWSTKVNKGGGLYWNSSVGIWPTNIPGLSGGGNLGALSIAVDDELNAYLTGYFMSYNMGAGNWATVKLDKSNGSKIYESIVTADSSGNDVNSEGTVAICINNKIYVLGNLQFDYNSNTIRNYPIFIEMDKDSASFVQRNKIETGYMIQSKTLDMKEFLGNNTIIYKQLGESPVVELYNNNRSLIWSDTINSQKALYGDKIVVKNDSDIFVSAHSIKESRKSINGSFVTDSIYIFNIDSTGSIKDNINFGVDGKNSKTFQILADSNNLFVFYNKDSLLYLRKYSNALSSEIPLSIKYNSVLNRPSTVFHQSDSTIIVFGKKGNSNKVIRINKKSLSITDLAVIPHISQINYAKEIGSNNYILAGKNLSNTAAIVSYDADNLDTNWTKAYSQNSSIYKFTFSIDSSIMYSIGTKNNLINVGKINTVNGNPIWDVSFNNPSVIHDQPKDILYDTLRNELIITGHISDINSSTNHVFIQALDTSGQIINTIIKFSDFGKANSGTCIYEFKDGTVWIGGKINTFSSIKAGYIFEVRKKYNFPVGLKREPDKKDVLSVYPNPSKGIITTEHEFFNEYKHNILQIYDKLGVKVGEYKLNRSSNKLNLNHLNSGIYFLKLNGEAVKISIIK